MFGLSYILLTLLASIEPAPQRIVSLNACTDQLLIELAEPRAYRCGQLLGDRPCHVSLYPRGQRLADRQGQC